MDYIFVIFCFLTQRVFFLSQIFKRKNLFLRSNHWTLKRPRSKSYPWNWTGNNMWAIKPGNGIPTPASLYLDLQQQYRYKQTIKTCRWLIVLLPHEKREMGKRQSGTALSTTLLNMLYSLRAAAIRDRSIFKIQDAHVQII
jgi:hypothetical protein